MIKREKGWLDERWNFSVEYGIRCTAIQKEDGIWRFNFYDRLYEKEMIRIIFENDEIGEEGNFYPHKQILDFHSDSFPEIGVYKIDSSDWNTSGLDKCLQIAHGVRIPKTDAIFLHYSKCLELWNVTKYCEQKEMDKLDAFEKSENFDGYLASVMYIAMFNDLRRLFAKVLSKVDSKEKLKEFLEKHGLEEMSGELMKMAALKFFDLST
ncbi:unnamed protein product [Caenorhabditis nigoni]|nr:hypothetical protein B9Z55_026777 [Caenorhabditis nigoni]